METYFVVDQKVSLEKMAEVMGIKLNKKTSICCCSPYFFTNQDGKIVALTFRSEGKMLVAFYNREKHLVRLASNIRFLKQI